MSRPANTIRSPRFLSEFFIVVQLVALCTILRVTLQDLPNFAPVAAMALFAGIWVQRKWLAMSAPIATMLVSDYLLNRGGYELGLTLIVYGSLTAPVWMAPIVEWTRRLRHPIRSKLALVTSTAGCVLSGSVLFFVATNLGVWWYWYDRDLAGLAQCFGAAIPFFRYTLLGDGFFGAVFLAVHVIALSFASSDENQPSTDQLTVPARS